MDDITWGVSQRGHKTLIYRCFEYKKYRENKKGETVWRCIKIDTCKCRATLKTVGDVFAGHLVEDHNHYGNASTALARKAVGEMKTHMMEAIATPSSSQAAVITNLAPHVQMALPQKVTLSRTLRRHRQVKAMIENGRSTLPSLPRDDMFVVPERYLDFLLHDSVSNNERMLVFGDRDMLRKLERASLWLADGTFKVVPNLFFQLYTIHFELPGGTNPSGIYALLPNKTRATYTRLVEAVKSLIPGASPNRILLDFESAAMGAFRDGFGDSIITGCYFHLCQSIIRKVNDVGLKVEYEGDSVMNGFIRCLPAISHVPEEHVTEAFDLLIEDMPTDDRVNELVTYFEHTYIRGRRRPGRGENYGQAIFPVPLWNQYNSAGEGIARTTNSVEGWHHSLQSLFMCQHPNMWTFLDGLRRDCEINKAAYLQHATGAQHLGRKKYRDLKYRVTRAVERYDRADIMTYLQAIAHLSHV